jgi:hypothetical protein
MALITFIVTNIYIYIYIYIYCVIDDTSIYKVCIVIVVVVSLTSFYIFKFMSTIPSIP